MNERYRQNRYVFCLDYMKKLKKKIIKNGAYLSLLVISVYLFPAHRYEGDGMYPSLRDGDLLVTARFSEAETDDIVLYKYDGQLETGRIAAGSGQKVKIEEDGKLFIDELFLSAEKNNYSASAGIAYPHIVAEESFFVLNDNRDNGKDSRMYGDIAERDEIGKVIFVLRRRGF